MAELTEHETQILTFEREWWRYDGSKEQAVRGHLDLSVARYYSLLNALIDRPEAVAADPLLVKRLRRMRDTRTALRRARATG
jgi:hypothetical protein